MNMTLDQVFKVSLTKSAKMMIKSDQFDHHQKQQKEIKPMAIIIFENLNLNNIIHRRFSQKLNNIIGPRNL